MPVGFTDIALDNNPLSSTYKDVALVNGDLPTVSGKAAIVQNVLQTLGIFFAEWFLNRTIGIDYLGKVLIKSPDQRIIDAIFQAQIFNVPGVTALVSYSFTLSNKTFRSVAVSFTAQTTDGIVNYTGTLPTGTVTTGATT